MPPSGPNVYFGKSNGPKEWVTEVQWCQILEPSMVPILSSASRGRTASWVAGKTFKSFCGRRNRKQIPLADGCCQFSVISVDNIAIPAAATVSGWWLTYCTPLKNMKVSWDDYSQYLKKNVPNHQPGLILGQGASGLLPRGIGHHRGSHEGWLLAGRTRTSGRCSWILNEY